jgi:hypothetical protein
MGCNERIQLAGVADRLEAWAECADKMADYYAEDNADFRNAGRREQERNKRDNYRNLARTIRECIEEE